MGTHREVQRVSIWCLLQKKHDSLLQVIVFFAIGSLCLKKPL